MSKEEARAAWLELVAAAKEYLKLPAPEAPKPPDTKKATPGTPSGKSQPASASQSKPKTEVNGKAQPPKPDAAKRRKVQATSSTKDTKGGNDDTKREKPKPIQFGNVEILLAATRMNPKYNEWYEKGLSGFEIIPSRPRLASEPLHVLAIDCEMVAVVGDDMALARLSVVELTDSWSAPQKTVLDLVVMPCTNKDYIVDTRSAITGLTVEDIVAKGFPFRMAIDQLKALFRPHTILVGHSLNSDLKALKIKYERIIDTALLFYVEGDPEKRTHSLAHLAFAMLGKEQARATSIHDSVEDAVLALKVAAAVLSLPMLENLEFPIGLPREESAARRQLAGESSKYRAMFLSDRIQVAEANLKSAVQSLKKV